MNPLVVSALHIHPVKSCRGHAVTQAALDARGLVGDRRFLIIDARGRFLTQRDTPALALITPTVVAGHITLAHPTAASPVSIAHTPVASATREVVIWHDTVRVIDLGDTAADWLQGVLGRPARLVGIGPDFSRPMREPEGTAGAEVAFTDAHPLLIIGEASLEDLNARLDHPVPMNRFRPNLVVRGAPAFAEDAWRRIRIGEVILRAAGPCARCVITTTDQDTLERGKEPLRTLATYRRDGRGEVNFGQNYSLETTSGELAVGDVIEVLA